MVEDPHVHHLELARGRRASPALEEFEGDDRAPVLVVADAKVVVRVLMGQLPADFRSLAPRCNVHGPEQLHLTVLRLHVHQALGTLGIENIPVFDVLLVEVVDGLERSCGRVSPLLPFMCL